MPQPSARDRLLQLLRSAAHDGTLVKLTLGKHRGPDPTLKNLFVRPVALKSGDHLTFVWRHTTRDITKNHAINAALQMLEPLIGGDFLDAHLFTRTQTVQFESKPEGSARIKVVPVSVSHALGPQPPPVATSESTEGGRGPNPAPSTQPGALHSTPANTAHDRPKAHLIPASAAWLRALGVTNDRGQPREGMADKFRQIQRFAELLSHLVEEAFPASANSAPAPPLRIADMGSGKGYLTFALAELFGARATIHGIEARRELVELCNRVARESALASNLCFSAGTIADAPLDACDILIALHACDTATDDALARGVAAGARLLVVAPCCQKELRRQLAAPPVLADALRHGIFQERQAEFVTDALRAQLLEWAGYRTKVFEFISTEHTAKNLMIAAIKAFPTSERTAAAQRTREFARFFGIETQQLARALGFPLTP